MLSVSPKMKQIYESYLQVASNLSYSFFSYHGHSSKFRTGLEHPVLELDEKEQWFLFMYFFVVIFV